jgi:hypothetical protein
LNVQQYCCAGLNFGYFYDQSPVILYDDEAAPDYSMGSFTASTVPGCRAPHFWLADGRSLYDELGKAYTLLCLKPVDATALSWLTQAAAEAGMPLKVLNLAATVPIPPEYKHAYVMVRADAHTVWRGHEITQSLANELVAALCGFKPEAATHASMT